MKLLRLVEAVKLIYPDNIHFSSTSGKNPIRNALSRVASRTCTCSFADEKSQSLARAR